MTVCKVAMANLVMWTRDKYFPACYRQATWKRLEPFFKLSGRVGCRLPLRPLGLSVPVGRPAGQSFGRIWYSPGQRYAMRRSQWATSRERHWRRAMDEHQHQHEHGGKTHEHPHGEGHHDDQSSGGA